MKILIWSDCHCAPTAPYSVPTNDGLTEHLHEVMDWFRWLQSLIYQEKPDMVIDLGDLFSTYGYVDVKSLHVAWAGVQAISTAASGVGAEYLFLLGNHDLYSSKVHNLPWLPGAIIDKPKVVTKDDIKLGFIPYNYKLDCGDEFVSIDPHVHLLFTHNDYVEIPYTSGHTPESGDSVQAFKGLAIFNGHYHIPSHRSFDSFDFYNVGSLGPRTFRDCGPVGGVPERHGAWLLNLSAPDKLEVQFLENPVCTYRVQVKQKNPSLLKDLISSGIGPQTIVRVETDNPADTVSPEDIAQFKKVDVVTLPPVVGADTSLSAAGLSIDSDPSRISNDFLRKCGEDGQLPEGLDMDKLVELTNTIVSKVKDQHQSRTLISQVHFVGVTAVDFMSLGRVAFDFPPGVYSVIGVNKDGSGKDGSGEYFENNGAGKTNLFELIYWVLTGSALRKLSAGDVIRDGCKECVGTLNLQVSGDAAVYTLQRTQRKKGGQSLQVYRDGEEITTRLQEGSYDTLTELLAVDGDLLRYLVFLMGGLSVSLTQLGPTDRFRLLESLVGDLAIYDACAKEVSSSLTSLSNIHENKRGELRGVEASMKQHSDSILGLQAQLNSDAQENEQVLSQMATQKVAVSVSVVACESVITSCTQALENSKTQLRQAREQYEGIQKTLLTRGEVKASVDASLNGLRVQYDREKRLADAGRCPTCGAETLTDDRCAGVSSLESQISVVVQQAVDADRELSGVQATDRKLREDIGKLDREIQGHEGQIRLQESHRVTYSQELSVIDQQVEALNNKRDNLELQIQTVEKERESAQDRKEHINLELVALEEKIRMLRVLYYPAAKAGIFSPSGVRSQVLESILDFLNFRCKEYSKYLLIPGHTVRIAGTTTTAKGKTVSKINIKLDGLKRSYASLSAGEARRVDLILHLALRDLAQASARFRANILVLDEVLDPMDDQGVKAVLRLLETFAGDTSVWILTQNNRLRGELNSGILVVKENGVSSVLPLEQ